MLALKTFRRSPLDGTSFASVTQSNVRANFALRSHQATLPGTLAPCDSGTCGPTQTNPHAAAATVDHVTTVDGPTSFPFTQGRSFSVSHSRSSGTGACALPISLQTMAQRRRAEQPASYEATLPDKHADTPNHDMFTQIFSRAQGKKDSPHALFGQSRTTPANGDRGGSVSREDGEMTRDTFTREQAEVLRVVLDGASVFIGGKAGTGKSFLLREIAHRLESGFGLCVAVTAATGVAALNIDGNTFHSTFGVPVRTQDGGIIHSRSSTSRLQTRRPLHSRNRITFDMDTLAKTDVIIVDEVSMLHAGYLEALERAARCAPSKNARKPFGGIQIILSGDFMQLTPFREGGGGSAFASQAPDRIICRGVGKESGAAHVVEESTVYEARKMPRRRYSAAHYTELPLYESYVFQHCLLHVQLRQVVRQHGDTTFLCELNQLRRGDLPSRLSRCAVLNSPDPDAIRLFAVKSAVKTFNERKMLEINGEEHVFRSEIQLHSSTDVRTEDAEVHLPRGRNLPATRVSSHASSRTSTAQTVARNGAPKRRFYSDTVLLHLHRLHNSRSRSLRTRPISQKDADAFLVNLCAASGVNSANVQGYRMPFPASRLLSNVSTVAVRCSGGSKREAVLHFGRVVVSAQRKIESQSRRVGDDGAAAGPCRRQRRRCQHSSNAPSPSKALTPMERSDTSGLCLVRCESYSTQRLISLLQPRIQHHFRRATQSDFVLQNKVLKVGCRVMLLQNLNKKYVNGSLGTVVAFSPVSSGACLLPRELKVAIPRNHLAARRLSRSRTRSADALLHTSKRAPLAGADFAHESTPNTRESVSEVKLPLVRMDADGSVVAIPWVALPWAPTTHEGFFAGKILCMPLAPAYAFTVHKIQGVTLDHSILFDGAGMFPCDHLLYVAASRVKRFSQLRWVNVSPRMISVHRPSLQFSDSIPSADHSAHLWTSWKTLAGRALCETTENSTHYPVTASQLYFPNWRSDN